MVLVVVVAAFIHAPIATAPKKLFCAKKMRHRRQGLLNNRIYSEVVAERFASGIAPWVRRPDLIVSSARLLWASSNK